MISSFLLISYHFLIIITTFFTFTLLLPIVITNKDKAILVILHPYFQDPSLHIPLNKKNK